MPHRWTSLLFDLDGTLVDSAYEHVLAWREAFDQEGMEVSVWRIHRRIGMSGDTLINVLSREIGLEIDDERVERLRRLHAEAFSRRAGSVRALPGTRELLAYLRHSRIPWAIATSGRMETSEPALAALETDLDGVPVVTGDMVRYAKPHPDLFLAAANALGVEIEAACIVGDSIWDMLAARRVGALGIGLLSGGYGRDELERGSASRIYEDPADLLRHIDELRELD
jgi:HAD superfamily hydrolase (TIGR01509 family)